jgi:hypothetical protein
MMVCLLVLPLFIIIALFLHISVIAIPHINLYQSFACTTMATKTSPIVYFARAIRLQMLYTAVHTRILAKFLEQWLREGGTANFPSISNGDKGCLDILNYWHRRRAAKAPFHRSWS